MNEMLGQSAMLLNIFYGVLLALLGVMIIQQTKNDGSRGFKLPDVQNLHPVTIAAMHGDYILYVYTALYSLQGKSYIQLPDNAFEEEARAGVNTSVDRERRVFEHAAERVLFEAIQEDGSIGTLIGRKSMKQMRKLFQQDKQKMRDLHLMRNQKTVRKGKFLYFFFFVIILAAGFFLIANHIYNQLDYAIPVALTAVGSLFFIFYRRPFDRKSNLGKKLAMEAINKSENKAFHEQKRMAYHTALFGYNTKLHKGSPTHTSLTTKRKKSPVASRRKAVDTDGYAENDQRFGDGNNGGDDGD